MPSVHEVDLVYYIVLAIAALEPVLWLSVVGRKMHRPRPGVLLPAILTASGVFLAAVIMAVISFILWNQGPGSHASVYYNPLLRRLLGGFLLLPVIAHWIWRLRLE